MNKIELLSPAGSLQKLKYALIYGADAVYAGLKGFSLRSGGLRPDELEKAVKLVRQSDKKIYVALNIFVHNSDIKEMEEIIGFLNKLKPDGAIVADPGLINLIRKKTDLRIHVSTQANITNFESVLFWGEQGVKRVVLARELSIDEIREINQKTKIQTEVFVHGAMCLSYSGRCFLSRHLDGRDANKGNCAQPCRWAYSLQEEESNECFPVEEDENGSYILSSKDLCLLEYLPRLIGSGVSSLKIEGRMKSIHYVSSVTKVYRQAIDAYYEDPQNFKINKEWLEELDKVSHRPYSTGFINQSPGTSHQAPINDLQVKGRESYMKTAEFVGEVTERENGFIKIAVRNKLSSGEKLDVLTPAGDNLSWTIDNMSDWASGQPLNVAHANYAVKVEANLQKYSLLRRSNAN